MNTPPNPESLFSIASGSTISEAMTAYAPDHNRGPGIMSPPGLSVSIATSLTTTRTEEWDV